MEDSKKIKSFEQLEVWKISLDWAVQVYEITRTFPKEETFGISSQIRRSVSSISANIAEGFGRQTIKDKLHFYVIAYGSVLETKNFLYLAHRLGYIDQDKLDQLIIIGTSVQKLLNAFMRPLKV